MVLQRLVRRRALATCVAAQQEENRGLESALESLDRGLKMESDGYAALIRECGNKTRLSEGRRIHMHMERCGYRGERYLENLLMEMYGKCGCLDDVKECFGRIGSPNEFSWTIFISAYAQNGHLQQALQLFSEMTLGGTKPNGFTFVAVINACAKLSDSILGKKLHELLVPCRFFDMVLVGNALIHMYGRCREIDLARMVFEQMPRKDVVTWNSMISAYAQNGHGKEALEIYCKMDTKPDKMSYMGAMEACTNTQDLAQGKLIHASIDIETDTMLENTILNMYGKCQSIADAKALFDKMQCPSFVSWNIMMNAYHNNGLLKEALGTFQKMDLEGFHADTMSFTSALDACAHARAVELGKAIHQSVRYCEDNSRNVSLDNALTNFYGRCGCPDEARKIFEQMPMRDVISWTAMISVYLEAGLPGEALEIYWRMNLEGDKPNKVTLKAAIDACAELNSLSCGRSIHAYVPETEEACVIVGNALVNLYSRCGELTMARAVFENLLERDTVSWTTIIRAYAQHGEDREVVRLFHGMIADNVQPDTVAFSVSLHSCGNLGDLKGGKGIHEHLLGCDERVKTDTVVCNTLLSMYAKCDSLGEAEEVFEGMVTRNTVTWNGMIKAYAYHGEFDRALELFERLDGEKEVKPDRVTFIVALDCCALKPSLEIGKKIHSSAVSYGFDRELFVGNTLVNMYGKSGQVGLARSVFEGMVERDVVTWTSLLSACACNGHGEEGLELFRLMQQDYTEPNEVTFLGVVFACSHLGLLEESKRHLLSMQQDYGLSPSEDHYSCVIDLLGRTGRLEEAEELVNSLPFQPDSVILTSLLGACITQGDLSRGIRAAEYVFGLDTTDQTPFVLLWNIYAASGNWNGVEKVKKALGHI